MWLRVAHHFFYFFLYITCFFLVSLWILFRVKDEDERRRHFTKNATRWARMGVKAFNIQLNAINRPADDEVFLYVGNHMGFLDIMVTAAIMPLSYVTSQEMREVPVLGKITEMGGCLYVDRRNRANINEEMRQMGETMKKGFRVVLFPEATSHNGEEILPFKRTLLMSASYAGVPIRPVVFNYLSIDGEPFSRSNRDAVCWYGDMTFMSSLFRSFCCKSIAVSVEFLPPYIIHNEAERAAIAEELRRQIVEKFIPVLEKRQAPAKEVCEV